MANRLHPAPAPYLHPATSARPETRPDGRPRLTRGMVRAVYVGERYAAFERSFQAFDQGGSLGVWSTLSWAAFFFGPFWFFYRKMYLEGAAILLFCCALGVVSVCLGWSSYADERVGFSLAVLQNITGRWFYWRSVDRHIAKARHLYRGNSRQALAWLQAQGGVNIWAVVAGVVIGLLVLLGSLLA